MNDIQRHIINSLEQKTIDTSLVTIALNAQGYVVNKSKREKLNWASILIHAFENYDILYDNQRNNIEYLYNKVFNV